MHSLKGLRALANPPGAIATRNGLCRDVGVFPFSRLRRWRPNFQTQTQKSFTRKSNAFAKGLFCAAFLVAQEHNEFATRNLVRRTFGVSLDIDNTKSILPPIRRNNRKGLATTI